MIPISFDQHRASDSMRGRAVNNSGEQMIGSLIRSISQGSIGAKAVKVLARTYGFNVDNQTIRRIHMMVQNGLADSYNEHEMAVHYLSDYVMELDPINPTAIVAVTKYIRIAKGARSRGLVRASLPINRLFESAQKRFGVSEAAISPA